MKGFHECNNGFKLLNFFLESGMIYGSVILYKTRKPVVTGRLVILSIFGSQFLSHQKKLSVTTNTKIQPN